MRVPKIFGKLAYVITYPLILLWLRGSKRAYVAIIADNDVLVTKNWLGLHKKWRLPGGGIRKNEPMLIGALREVKEELGIELPEAEVVMMGEQTYHAKAGYTYTLFTVTLPQKPAFAPNTHELIAATWIPLAKLAKQPISLEVKTALAVLKTP